VIQSGSAISDNVSFTGDFSGYYGFVNLYNGSLLNFNPSVLNTPAKFVIGGTSAATTFVKKGGALSLTADDGTKTTELQPYGVLDFGDAGNSGNLTLANSLYLPGYDDPNPGRILFKIGSVTPNKIICSVGTLYTDNPVNGQIDVSKQFWFDMQGATGTSGVTSDFIFAHTLAEPFITGTPNVVNYGQWSNISVTKAAAGGGWDIRLTATYFAPVKVRVETLADGTGMLVPEQDVTAGNTVTVYAIRRDASDNFVDNVAATDWTLENKTGGIADGDLVAAGDNKSAVFTGHHTGTTTIKAASLSLTPVPSGLLTVIPAGMNQFALNLAGCQNTGASFTGTNTLTAQDIYGNTIASYNAATNHVTITSSPSNGTITGLGASSNNVLDQLTDFTSGTANLSGTLLFTGTTGKHTFMATSSSGGFTGTSDSVTVNGPPTGTASQSFCHAATVADLTATGNGIKWYAASSGGTALISSTVLSDGIHYYASQTVGSCESVIRLDVTVTINQYSAGGTVGGGTTVCYANNSTLLTLSGNTGSVIKWQLSTNGSTWNDIASTEVTQTAASLTATTQYRAVVQNGVCPQANSASGTVVVNPLESIVYVDPSYSSSTPGWHCDRFNTIQPAVDRLELGNGGTVNVAAGTYAEHVTINKTITLNGAGKLTTIITGGGMGQVLSVVSPADSVIVNGFTISNSGSDLSADFGIGMVGVNHCTIENNLITGNANGLFLSAHAHDNTILNNTVSNTGYHGIFLYNSTNANPDNSSNVIQGNAISGCGGSAIYADQNSNANTISWNTISASAKTAFGGTKDASGIFFYKSNDNTVSSNSISNNAEYGIDLHEGSHGNSITQNEVTGNQFGGVFMHAGTSGVTLPNTLSYNKISGNTGFGANGEWFNSAINNYWSGPGVCPAVTGPVSYYPYYTSVSGTPGYYLFGAGINNLTATATVNPVCTGSSTTLYATGCTDYFWDNGLGSGASKVVSPTTSTTYHVTAKDANGCSSANGSVAVAVNPAPVVLIAAGAGPGSASGGSVINPGSSENLTASGATTYVWNTGSTSQTISVAPVANTVYSVSGSVTGCAGTATHTVTVASVTAGPNKFICAGSSATLSVTTQGFTATGYLWAPGGMTTQSVTVSPLSTTQYNVTVTGSSGFQVTALTSVFVNPRPVANAGPDITIAPAGSGTLTGSASAATAPYVYAWTTTGGSFVSGNSTAAPVVNEAGTYTLMVTDAFGCISPTDDAVVTVVSSGTTVSGNVAYAFNTVNNQMHDVAIALKLGGSTIYSTSTAAGGQGNYQFLGVANGTYTVSLSSTKPWGGVTATDIVLIQNHYKTPPTPLIGIKRLAADVVDNSPAAIVQADDRDLINNKRLTPTINFPTGNWVFTRAEDISAANSYPSGGAIKYANSNGYSDITITVAGTPVVQDFRALCYGDVDASYTGLKDNENSVVNLTTINGLDLANYPNPFPETTTIRFTVPVMGSVVVVVHDMLGMPVAIIRDPDDYDGVHTLTFYRHGLAPGIYLYTVRVKTSDDIFIQTGKLLIVD